MRSTAAPPSATFTVSLFRALTRKPDGISVPVTTVPVCGFSSHRPTPCMSDILSSSDIDRLSPYLQATMVLGVEEPLETELTP
jgi:hypothetical protein